MNVHMSECVCVCVSMCVWGGGISAQEFVHGKKEERSHSKCWES